jgi:adenylate kinase
MDLRTIIFYGRTGSGKGTQSQLLKEYLENNDRDRKTLYIATGVRFRELMGGDNYTSKMIREILDNGGLQPEFLPIWIWTEELMTNFTGHEHLIFDGLARRPAESPILSGALNFYKRLPADVIMINVSEQWSAARLLARGRHDDSQELIANRLREYENNIVPSIAYFRNNRDYRFHDINGEQTIEQVHGEIISSLKLDQP